MLASSGVGKILKQMSVAVNMTCKRHLDLRLLEVRHMDGREYYLWVMYFKSGLMPLLDYVILGTPF